jgi:BRCA1-associated protein
VTTLRSLELSFCHDIRYKEGHAVNHWKESQHCYSLDLETQRVWDYVGDGYVHRLIQSKTDGKLVELPAPCRDGSDDCSSCEAQNQREDMDAAIYSSKLDAIKDEYDHLLTTQLESQRKYYEGRLAEMEEDREAAIQHAVEGVLNHKMRKLQARCEKVEMENRDLKELNKSLTDNQKLYQQRIKEVEERYVSDFLSPLYS